MKYTKGPWRISNEHDEIGKGPYIICHYSGLKERVLATLNHHFPYEADARLIAAAPDMYEALKDLTRIIVTLGDINALNDAVKNALDAINKADCETA